MSVELVRPSSVADLRALEGTELGPTDWVQITQEKIDAFAQVTGDHQWIHVDPERAAASPMGSTIAHGLLTLSLAPDLAAGPTLAMAATKALVREAAGHGTRAANARIDELTSHLIETEDAKIAVRTFLEEGPRARPVFEGR